MTSRLNYESRYTDDMLPPVTWTEAAEDHIARHAVQPHEVEDVLYGRPRFISLGRDDTRLVFGTTSAGRLLFVVIAEAIDGGLSIVTARDMTASEKRLFRKKGT